MVSQSGLRRVAHIILVLAKYGLAHMLGRWPRLAGRLPARLSGPERLRSIIEDLGGTFIKFGQMLALQPDILSIEYCNALFNLLDRVAPFEFEHVDRIFIEELGRPPSEIFDHFQTQPIATASIGQVHVGYVNGRKVAVKVQRPTVETDFAGDIRLMVATIGLIKRLRLKSAYWMIEPMSEFIGWTKEEMDYRREGRYMQQLYINSQTSANERVPEILWEFTTRRTLVAEFFEGVTVLDYLRAVEAGDEVTFQKLRDMRFEPNRFASNIIENFLSDVRHGVFHADLHPANLMILPDSVVGYIDFGITGVLSHYSRQHIVGLTLAYTRADLDGMCESFIKGSVLGANADVRAFREGLRKLGDEWYGMQGKERRLLKNFTLVMLDMLRLSRETDIWPARDVIKYIRSGIAIDGLITRFAPGFDVGRYLETVCNHYLKWEARRAMFSYDSLLALSNSSGHLMRDGALRAASLLHRVAGGEMPARAEIGGAPGGTDNALALRGIYLAVIVFAISLLITVTGERMQLGVNMFTAEAILLAAAAMALLRTIRRLA